MNAENGVKARAAVAHAVKASLRSSTIWKKEIEDSIQSHVKSRESGVRGWESGVRSQESGVGSCQSTVGCLQIYSDKSQTSLSARSYLIHPLYVTLLNFTEYVRR